MSQYNPQAQPQQQQQQQQPQGGAGSGRGSGRGGYQGRGQGRGQQQARGGRGQPMGAWQPSGVGSSLQQAAYGRQPQPQTQQAYHPGHPGAHPQQQYPANLPYNPYAAQQAAYRGAPQGGWQPTAYPPQGGVYYPPQQQQQQQQQQPPPPLPGAVTGATPGASGPVAAAAVAIPVVVPPKPREKKPLVITDKDGNVLDFRSEKAKTSSLKAAVSAEAGKTATSNGASTAAATTAPGAAPPKSSEDAGKKLREAALARLGKDTEKPAEIQKAETTSKTTTVPKTAAQIAATPPVSVAPTAPTPVSVVSTAPTPVAKEPVQLEKKEPVPKEKTLADIAAAPAPAKSVSAAAAATTTVTSGGSSLAATAKKPTMAAMATTPAPAAGAAGGLRPGGKTREAAATGGKGGRLVYDKTVLMRLKTTDACMKRPEDLSDMSISKGPPKQQAGQGGGNRNRANQGGGGNWDRGQAQRRNSQTNDRNDGGGGGGDWQRGQAPPKNKNKQGRRGSQNNHNQPPLSDGPVAPLVRSDNGWKPSKDKNPMAIAEKSVKGILNKMTKEKFDRLAAQMCDIQILSYDMLTMMIHHVYEKAIDEPAFGDMYADLCVRLSKGAAQANNDFVKIIESDEEPPTEGDEDPVTQQSAGSSSHVVYRWSNDVSTTDSEVVGPFKSVDETIEAALDDSGAPEERGERKLELVKLVIKKGIFIKILKEAGEDSFYAVYFPVSEAKECGQQLSEIFLSEVECVSNAKKKNSFKRSLLNKCEDEFKKEDIYVIWKKEKKEYEESKDKLTPTERAEREAELDFRRIKIKKQMLGNIKFIGQLYKKGLIKEKIMRFCIGSLLKLEELEGVKSKNPEYKDSGDVDMDEEDHEAICSMFTTIGSTIDKPPATDFMKVCFTKIHQLSQDKKNLPARSRFMYKDLLELRENNWVPRRDEGKAKTLEEIRKDVEKEEQRQAQISQQSYRDDRNNQNRRTSNNYDNRRGSTPGGRGNNTSRGSGVSSNRRDGAKPQTVTDDDGFTVIARGAKGAFEIGGDSSKQASQNVQDKKGGMPNSGIPGSLSGDDKANTPAPLSQEKLKRRIKSMRAEYVQDPSNIDELLLSADELTGTKDYGLTLVAKSASDLLECKEAERNAITDILQILYERKKLTSDDIRNGLGDFIEFIDDMVVDCPKLYEYMGDLLAPLFRLKAVDVQWFTDTLEKTKTQPECAAPEKLTRATIASIRASGGTEEAQSIFGKSGSNMNALVGADKWNAISNDLLG